MVRDSGDPRSEQGSEGDPSAPVPWQHNPTVVFAAGALGVVLLLALVITVVRMSDRWTETTDPVPGFAPTVRHLPTTTSPRSKLIVTPTESSTTYTTSVPLSTTEIGLPPPELEPESPTETDTETPDPDDTETTTTTTTTTTETTAASDADDATATTTTTRKRPRLNETRTLGPQRPY